MKLDARYAVAVPRPESGTVEVTLRLAGVPRDSLRLRSYGSPSWMRISGVTALDLSGRAIRVTQADERLDGDGGTFGRWTIHGPLPRDLVVRYVARPGQREGDAHTGFVGRSSGYVGKAFGLFTGRNVFLVPEGTSTPDLAVTLSGPVGWRPVATWRGRDSVWRPEPRHGIESLIAGTMAIGRFHETTVRIGATDYRFEVESTAPPEEQIRAVDHLKATARWVRDRFDRDLRGSYMTVVVPCAPTGDDVLGGAWATGQGRTLMPATPARVRDFARSLLEAYLVFPPGRSEIRDPAQFWLVDAVRGWVSRRAAARVAGIDPQELLRESAVFYLDAIRARNVEKNLEEFYARGAPSRAARESIAPFVIAAIDQEIRDRSRSGDSLDRILPELFPNGRASSFWDVLPGGAHAWATFRERYVRGGEQIMASRYFDLDPTRPNPDSLGGPPTRWLTLFYSGNTYGFLENCGCKSNQSGGVARRATVLRQARKRDPAALYLDAGNSFARADKIDPPDDLSRQEQGLYVATMSRARCRASVLGVTELSQGLDYFNAVTSGATFPYLLANVRRGGKPLGPADTVVGVGGLRVGIVGILERPVELSATDTFQRHTADLEFQPPLVALADRLPPLRRRCDLVVVMGRLMPATIREIARRHPEIGVIVSTEYQVPTQVPKMLEPTMSKNDAQGFLGRTLVLYATMMNYGLSEARLGLDRAGHIVRADARDHWLESDVPDDPEVRDLLSRFYDRVGLQEAAQSSVAPPFREDAERMEARYVGARACAGCHAAEFEQWKTTRHAAAFKTLLDRHRHFQPRCVSCHVVGYGAKYGYRLGDREEPLGNVQCEICHGPGERHARHPLPENIRGIVPASLCLTCHNSEHSDAFVYSQKLPLVVHKPMIAASSVEGPSYDGR